MSKNIDHRHRLLAHAVFAGKDHYQVLLILNEYDPGPEALSIFTPRMEDIHGNVFWTGETTFRRIDAINQLKRLEKWVTPPNSRHDYHRAVN